MEYDESRTTAAIERRANLGAVMLLAGAATTLLALLTAIHVARHGQGDWERSYLAFCSRGIAWKAALGMAIGGPVMWWTGYRWTDATRR